MKSIDWKNGQNRPSVPGMNRRDFLFDGFVSVAGLGAAAAAPAKLAPLTPQVAVMAELLFKPGTGAKAAQALSQLADATRRECGCRRYIVARDLDNPDRFHLSELWSDLGALAAHFETPHMASFSAEARALGYAAPFLKRLRIAELADLKPADLRSVPRAQCAEKSD